MVLYFYKRSKLLRLFSIEASHNYLFLIFIEIHCRTPLCAERIKGLPGDSSYSTVVKDDSLLSTENATILFILLCELRVLCLYFDSRYAKSDIATYIYFYLNQAVFVSVYLLIFMEIDIASVCILQSSFSIYSLCLII